MPRYIYQVKSSGGQVQTGQIDALDENEVRAKLKAKNLTPIRIVSQGGGGGGFKLSMPKGGGRVNSRDLQIFTRQFSTLINAGIPIVDGLKILGEGKRNPTLKDAANKVRESIESGKRLGDAMAAHTNVFDKFYINMVRAGEEAGILDGILNRLSVYLEKSEKIKKQVVGAMFYPVAIIFVATIVIFAILLFIIPKFQELYKSSGKGLPMITQKVVDLSELIQARWYVFVIALVGLPYAAISYYRTPEGRDTCDRIFINLPIFGDLIQKTSVARMTRTLSTLLSSGVGVIEALDIASKTAGNAVVEEALIRSKESVTAGKPLAAPLAKEKMIPDMVVQMIAIGEQSGTMDQMLSKIADFYEDDVETSVKAMTTLIEPLLMVVLGGIIAALMVAMYLPIFDIANTAG